MEIPVITGAYREIIRATPEGADHPWFTNDHTFIRGENGLWHCYAIVAVGVKVPDFAGESVPRPVHSSFSDRKLLPSMVTVSQ